MAEKDKLGFKKVKETLKKIGKGAGKFRDAYLENDKKYEGGLGLK